MSVTDIGKIVLSEINPGILLGVIGKSESMTFTYSLHEAGSIIPEHKHIHEQVGYCLKGQAKYTIGKQ